MAPEISKTREAVRSCECEEEEEEEEDLDSEIDKLEFHLKEMGQKILEYRATLPDHLKSTFLSVLDSQRPFLPQLNSGASEHIYREESSSEQEDPEAAAKLKLLRKKISSNCSAMPIVLKRMKDCIARFDKLDSYNPAYIHQDFKRKKTG